MIPSVVSLPKVVEAPDTLLSPIEFHTIDYRDWDIANSDAFKDYAAELSDKRVTALSPAAQVR